MRERPSYVSERRRVAAIWLVAASVLAYSPNSYTFPKLTITLLAVLVATTTTALGRLPRAVIVTGFLGLGVVVLAALLGETPEASLLGRWPRHEGVPMLLAYAATAWLGARVVGRDVTGWRRAEEAIAGLGVALGVLTALALAGHSAVPSATADRIGTVLGNATDHGLVAMTIVLCLLPSSLSGRQPWLWAGLAGGTVALLGSASRAPLAATVLLVGGAAALMLRRLESERRRAPLLLGAGLILLVALAVILPTLRTRLLSSQTLEGRLLQWRPTLELIGDHPFLGIGPNRYLTEFTLYETRDWVTWAGPYAMVDSPHSWLLQAFVAGGLPLALLALVALALVLREGWQSTTRDPRRMGLFLAVAGYALATLPHFTNPASTLWAAFLAGILVAAPAADPGPGVMARAAVGVAGAATLIAASAWVSDAYIDQGLRASAEGDVEGAIANFDHAVTWRPWDYDVSVMAARALAAPASAGSAPATDASLRHAQRALTTITDDYEVTVAFGVALTAHGEAEHAVDVLGDAIALAPRRPSAYVQRAVAHLHAGNRALARQDLRTARRIAPRDPQVQELLELTGPESREDD